VTSAPTTPLPRFDLRNQPKDGPLVVWLPGWDLRPDSLNDKRGKHWSHAQRRARIAKEAVGAALVLGTHRRFLGLVEVRVTRWMKPRQRALDDDNASAACKPLVDALVHHRVLVDDSPKHVRLARVRFERARTPEAQGTAIEIQSASVPA
jgi:hypothetical protein